jgi:hypothetical protein
LIVNSDKLLPQWPLTFNAFEDNDQWNIYTNLFLTSSTYQHLVTDNIASGGQIEELTTWIESQTGGAFVWQSAVLQKEKRKYGNTYILPIMNKTFTEIKHFCVFYSTGKNEFEYTLINLGDNTETFHILHRYFNTELVTARIGGKNASKIYVDIESVISYQKNCTPVYTVYVVHTDWYQIGGNNVPYFLGTTFDGFEVEITDFYCDNGQGGPSPGPNTTIISSTGTATVSVPPAQSFIPCITYNNLWQGPYASEASINFIYWDITFDLWNASVQNYDDYEVSLNMNLSFNYLPDMFADRDLTAQAVDAAFKEAYHAAYGTVMYTLGNNFTLSYNAMQTEINRVFTSSFDSFMKEYLGELDPTIQNSSIRVNNNVDPDANSLDPNDCLQSN